MSNDQYTGRLTGLADGVFYTAENVAQFNALIGTELAAFCLFTIRGGYQELGAVDPTQQWLWGNLSGNTGWALELAPDGANGVLRASLGTGAAVVAAEAQLFAPNVSGPIERLILAGLWWWDETTLALTINGNIVATAAAAAYGPSAVAARLGAAAGAVPANGAKDVDILACGYGNPVASAGNPSAVGTNSGQHFRDARSGLHGGPVSMNVDVPGVGSTDWTHRYEVASFGGLQGAVTKFAGGGAQLTQLPVAPASWPDVGNFGAPVTPVALARTGVPFVDSMKNPDWYEPISFVFAGQGGG